MNGTDLAPILIGCGEEDNEGARIPSAELIGFKAHNLARMVALGLRVPPAFVLGTPWCANLPALKPEVWRGALESLEMASGARFGDPSRPLLLSVRSGAAVSMPGMMSTLLDIGLNDQTVLGLVRMTGNPRLAWDAYRRLVSGFGETVLGIAAQAFGEDRRGVADGLDERDLDFDELREITRRHLATVQRLTGQPFPQSPDEQLLAAIQAVFSSWGDAKAQAYRRANRLSDDLGTAVTVQRMVFGNAGGLSGAGVGFTRHPSTGAPVPWVDFLFNAQGEDVVSGRRSAAGHEELAAVAPAVWRELQQAVTALEQAFHDMQDFEFTVEDGCLYLLQTRAGKRTPQAATRIALDMLDAGLISREEALRRTADLDPERLSLTRVVADTTALSGPLGSAQSACTGAVTGEIVLDAASARAARSAGRSCILVRQDAETSDLEGLEAAAGLLTARGARTSHAAVIARQLGKVCLVGCAELRIDLSHRVVILGGRTLAEGSPLTLDGNEGTVFVGSCRIVSEPPPGLVKRLAALRAATTDVLHGAVNPVDKHPGDPRPAPIPEATS